MRGDLGGGGQEWCITAGGNDISLGDVKGVRNERREGKSQESKRVWRGALSTVTRVRVRTEVKDS